jgi:hypothetical protein
MSEGRVGERAEFGPSTPCTQFALYTGRMEYRTCWLPPRLYLDIRLTAWGNKFKLFYWFDFLKQVIIIVIFLWVHRLSPWRRF